MRRLPIYTLLFLLIFSCKEKEVPEYTIQGNDVKEGTVSIWSNDEKQKEIISANCNGSFAISIALRDTTSFTLVLPDGKTIPLYAEPGTTATLQPDTTLKSGWSVIGNSTQALHDSISRVLDATTNFAEQKKIIESFIGKYPISEVNVELFRRYLIDVPNPDNEYLRKTISKLGGVMQDHRYFVVTKKTLDKKTGDVKHRMFPTFFYTTIDGKKVNLGTYADKYLLVNFWATWNSESHESVKKLREIKNGVKSESFEILNISLDSDTAIWANSVTGDSIIGDNVLDRKGMNSEILETFNIASFPTRYLSHHTSEFRNMDWHSTA